MGQMAYWHGGLRALASLPLGDAHPGGTWPYARGEQLRGSAATTPRAAGPFFIGRKCYALSATGLGERLLVGERPHTVRDEHAQRQWRDRCDVGADLADSRAFVEKQDE